MTLTPVTLNITNRYSLQVANRAGITGIPKMQG